MPQTPTMPQMPQQPQMPTNPVDPTQPNMVPMPPNVPLSPNNVPPSIPPNVPAPPEQPQTPMPPEAPPPPGISYRNVTVRGSGGGLIYDYHTTNSVAVVRGNCILVRGSASLSGRHTFHSDLTVSLRSPSGRSTTLQSHSGANPFRSYSLGSFANTNASGMWMVSISDTVRADSGILQSFTLNLTCR